MAHATGLGVETLRAWERRYGRPRPLRRASGHRRYRVADVAWLRLVAQAVGAGSRPSDVVPLDVPALRRLAGARVAPVPPRWLGFVRRFDGPALARAIRAGRADAPTPAAFLDGVLVPFLAALGTRWARGRLAIRHEHFASEVVGRVVARMVDDVPLAPGAPSIVLATLPGERHVLGLGLAALAAVAVGVRPQSLGPDTPPDEIAAAVAEGRAAAVGIAVSPAARGPATRRALSALRASLPPSVRMVVGGGGIAGPRRLPPGIERAGSFADLAAWLRALPAGRRPSA